MCTLPSSLTLGVASRKKIKSRSKGQIVKETVFAEEKFESLGLHPFMISNLESNFSITTMTVVQKTSIPVIMTGKDSLIKSQTGSGKTLAYAIPVIQKLQDIRPKVQRSDGTLALVIVPTRELALQTYECFRNLLKSFTWVVPGYLMGGEKKKSEKSRIRKGINILVTTPGRLVDHVQHTANLSLKSVKWLVVDEADRLLDMGYEKDIATVINALNEQQLEKRQTIMLSATMSSGVEKLAGITLTSPEVIDVAATEIDPTFGRLVTPEHLQQQFVTVPVKLRLVTLVAFILWKCKATDERKILIFMPTQDMVDFHYKIFKKLLNQKHLNNVDLNRLADGDNSDVDESEVIDIYRLHGNMSQQERTQMFNDFKDASQGILLATDVAARGLDLPEVNWIVQYSGPSRPADYVHRVGRTARIGGSGNALLFVLPSESAFVEMMEQENISLQEVTVDTILNTLTPGERQRGKRPLSRSVETAVTSLQLHFESALLQDHSLLEASRSAFQSYVRSYASYPAPMKHVFNMRALHLGHVAKSLALRETPSRLGTVSSELGLRQKQIQKTRFAKKNEQQRGRQQQSLSSAMSEFESGLAPVRKKPKMTRRHCETDT